MEYLIFCMLWIIIINQVIMTSFPFKSIDKPTNIGIIPLS